MQAKNWASVMIIYYRTVSKNGIHFCVVIAFSWRFIILIVGRNCTPLAQQESQQSFKHTEEKRFKNEKSFPLK